MSHNIVWLKLSLLSTDDTQNEGGGEDKRERKYKYRQGTGC